MTVVSIHIVLLQHIVSKSMFYNQVVIQFIDKLLFILNQCL